MGDVFVFQDRAWIATQRYVDHSHAKVFQSTDLIREESSQERIERAECPGYSVRLLETFDRIDETGPERIRCFEGELPQVVFSSSLDSGPHQATVLGAVGSRARNVAKGHSRIEPRNRASCLHGEVVRETGVFIRLLADGSDSETEIAGVVAPQRLLDRRVVKKIPMDQLLQFRVLCPARPPVDDKNRFHIGMVETDVENTFTDHSGRAKNDCIDFHCSFSLVHPVFIARRIVALLLPFCRIPVDVDTDGIKFPLAPNDVIVVFGLPAEVRISV